MKKQNQANEPEITPSAEAGQAAAKPEVADTSAFDTKFIVTITLKLLLISAVTALLLAGVNALTADKIADNIALEKAGAILAIFPEADENRQVETTAEGVDSIYLVLSGGDLLGYAASVSPLGFGGELDVMVGVNADGSLAGIKIVSHSETPGLGSRVDNDEYLSQYIGLGGNLSLGTDVDAITGSTISSKAILAGVNSALSAYGSVFTENDAIANGGSK